jgi:VRR-NUC domain
MSGYPTGPQYGRPTSHDWRRELHQETACHQCGAKFGGTDEYGQCPNELLIPAPLVTRGVKSGPHTKAKAPANLPGSETQLLAAIRDALLATGRCLLWRNNTGKLQDARGRWVSFGLGEGSPDLIGILRARSPCAHMGRFLAIEVKLPGKSPEVAQACWHRAAREAGALVIVAHSVAEALAGLEEA